MPDDLDALLEAVELKDERRTGWVLRGVERPESVAAHTWGVAYLCLLYAERADAVDRDRAVRMALLHDLGEARTGDVVTRAETVERDVSPEEKEAAERAAVAELLAPFEDGDADANGSPEESHRSLWEEYEARETPTARFVKDMDLVDNCLQALAYEREDRYDPDAENEHFETFENLDEFFATAAPRLSTSVGRDLFERIKSRYEDEIGRECRLE